MSADAAAEHAHHHHALMPDDWPVDDHYGKASAGKLGMWIFLLSDALTFAGFLLAYAILRGSSEQWIPEGQPELGINFTAFLTFLLICSSVSMVMAYAAIVEKNQKLAVKWLCITVLGGILFLCGQYKEYWGFAMLGHAVEGFWPEGGHWIAHGLIPDGLTWGSSHYATTFYCVTAFHGMHVFSGVVYLIVITIRTARGAYNDGNYNHIEICGLFWHFVDLVWILVFTFIYLIPN